jgi:hypothetical protein
METVPNVEKPLLLGKGTLLVSCPRNRTLRAETMAGREAGTWSGGVEVGPPSYVTFRVQSSLIREGPLLPPVVRRCLIGSEVIQRQRTGRVVQVGAAGLQKRFVGELAARQWQGRFCVRLQAGRCPGGTGRRRTTKERTGKTRHQQCPLLVNR